MLKDRTRIAHANKLIAEVVDQLTIGVDAVGTGSPNRIRGVRVDGDGKLGSVSVEIKRKDDRSELRGVIRTNTNPAEYSVRIPVR